MPVRLMRNDAETVAVIVFVPVAAGHTDCRSDDAVVSCRGYQSAAAGPPPVQPETGIARHSASRCRYAAVPGAVFHPGSRDEGIALTIRAVVVQRHIAGGHPLPGGVGDDGVGVGFVNAQGMQDAPPQYIGIRGALNVLQQAAQQFVAGVGIMESGTRLPGRRNLAQGIGFVAGGGGKIAAGRQAGGMAQ